MVAAGVRRGGRDPGLSTCSSATAVARLALTVLAVPLFLSGVVLGGFLSSLVAASAVHALAGSRRATGSTGAPRARPARPAPPPAVARPPPPAPPPRGASGPRPHQGFGSIPPGAERRRRSTHRSRRTAPPAYDAPHRPAPPYATPWQPRRRRAGPRPPRVVVRLHRHLGLLVAGVLRDGRHRAGRRDRPDLLFDEMYRQNPDLPSRASTADSLVASTWSWPASSSPGRLPRSCSPSSRSGASPGPALRCSPRPVARAACACVAAAPVGAVGGAAARVRGDVFAAAAARCARLVRRGRDPMQP